MTQIHYSTNTLPQAMVQGMQGLSVNDPAQFAPMVPATQYVQTPAGYYPVYMSYPQIPMYQSQPVMQYYQPSSQFAQTARPMKRRPSAKPSQFKPQPTVEQTDHGEHKAENEDYILSVIKEFLDQESGLGALKGKVTGLALTQTGSRFLQKQLTKANPAFVSFVLQEVEKDLPTLMTDDYGNYFCQRLVSSCSPAQRIAFLTQVPIVLNTEID